jgi:hypothetical protein
MFFVGQEHGDPCDRLTESINEITKGMEYELNI